MEGALRVGSATIFYPRGGSAFVTRSLAGCLTDRGVEVRLLTGSRSDIGELGRAQSFYAGADLESVDFTPSLVSADPTSYAGPPGTAPLHPSFEDRPGAADRCFASL